MLPKRQESNIRPPFFFQSENALFVQLNFRGFQFHFLIKQTTGQILHDDMCVFVNQKLN